MLTTAHLDHAPERLIDREKLEAMIRALEAGATKASLCRTFDVRRSTLNDALARSGWRFSA